MDLTPRNRETFVANLDRLWRWIGSRERARSLVSWFKALRQIRDGEP